MSGVVNVAFYIGGGECRRWGMSGWRMSHNQPMITTRAPDGANKSWLSGQGVSG